MCIRDRLVVIDLSSNRIRDMETPPGGGLGSLTALQVLDLSDNSLATLPPPQSTFHALVDLRRLRLNNNILQTLPAETLAGNSRLEFLDLSFNLIESVPDNLFNANSSLITLDLSDNVITDIGQFLLHVPRLRHLDVSGNFLSELHWSLFVNLVHLVYLDVRDNRLVGELGGRLLSSVPQLEQLMVDNNDVTRAVQSGRPTARLVRLTMTSNSLTELPRLLHAPQLALLDVTNNDISVVTDDSFTCCQNLRRLRLDSNRITSISVNAFGGLTRLTEVDLSDNRLSYLSAGLFERCLALSDVNLSRNQLTVVDVGWPTSLRQLDLSWNKLTTFSGGSIHQVFFTLERLSLAYNPLQCDCQLTWLGAYSALVEHNTTICCTQSHDWRPAACLYVVCVTCPVTTSSLHDSSSALCARTVPSPLIAALFQPPTTTQRTLDVTSLGDMQASDVSSPVTSTSRHAVSTDDCVVVTAVVVPVLAVALLLAIIAAVRMRRRSIVEWNDDVNKCPATAVSRTARPDCTSTDYDVA